MRKDVLQDLIAAYDKQKWSFRSDNLTIQWLKQFMTSKEISLLSADQDIRFVEFFKWMNENVKVTFEEHFTEQYFNGGSDSGKLFKKFIRADEVIKDPKNIGNFGELPPELLPVIFNFIDTNSLKQLSKTSSAFFSETKKDPYWQDQIIAAGVSPTIVGEVITSKLVTDYRKLYFNLLRAKNQLSLSPTDWELICLSGNPSAVENFIKKIPKDNYGYALGLISFSGSVDAIKVAAAALGINPNICDRHRRNALHYAALSGNPEVIKAAAALGIDRKSIDINGKNALHYAALSGNPDAIKAAAALGIDPNIADDMGRNALHHAAKSGNPDAIKAAAELGIKPKSDDGGKNALHFAALSGNPEAIKAAAALGIDRKSIDLIGNNALHYAALSGNPEAIKTAALGIDRKSIDKLGKNALHCAALSGNPDAINAAAELGINPESDDGHGKNALHYAALSGNPEAIKAAATLKIDLKSSIRSILSDCLPTTKFKFATEAARLESILLIRRLCFEREIDISKHVNELLHQHDNLSNEIKNALEIPAEKIPPTGITQTIEPEPPQYKPSQ